MTCPKCGSKTWSDDDLHWLWCHNPKCVEFYGNNTEKMRDYNAEIAYRERLRLEQGKE